MQTENKGEYSQLTIGLRSTNRYFPIFPFVYPHYPMGLFQTKNGW